MNDFKGPISKAYYLPTEEEKKEGFKELLANHFPKYFGYWEKKLTENSSQNFLTGDSVTVADFLYLGVYASFINNSPVKEALMSLLDAYPTTAAYFKIRWNAQKDYFDNRPEAPH